MGVEILGEKLVLFRDKQGKVQCLSDVCPHRGAPLHKGWVDTVDGHDCVVRLAPARIPCSAGIIMVPCVTLCYAAMALHSLQNSMTLLRHSAPFGGHDGDPVLHNIISNPGMSVQLLSH